jgi:hypothetical protein
MLIPALSQEHVCPNVVLLQLRPSLPSLRRKSPSIVRPVHRYLRRSPTSPARACPSYGFWPSRTGLRMFPPARWRSPGSRACCLVSVHGLLDYAGPDSHSRITRLPYCLPLSRNRVGILFFRLFEARSPRPTDTSGLRFGTHLTMCSAKLEVRIESLAPFP